jgi:hypothetical protein
MKVLQKKRGRGQHGPELKKTALHTLTADAMEPVTKARKARAEFSAQLARRSP